MVGMWLGSVALGLTPPDGLPERQAIAMDVVATVLPPGDDAGVDAAVVHVEEWDDAFAGAAELRVDPQGAQMVAVMSLGVGHDTARLHVGMGPSVQALIGPRALLAPGPWLRATVHPKDEQTRSTGLLDDLRNAEGSMEVRGAWWWELPDRPLTWSMRAVGTVGSQRLRYGVVGEVPLHLPAPTDPVPWMVGGRIEVRPKPRRRSFGGLGGAPAG